MVLKLHNVVIFEITVQLVLVILKGS